MSKRLSVRLGGLCIEADLSNASMILKEPIGQQSSPNTVNISVAEGTKQYDVMGYTTDITTMRLIFQNKTLRSSSLSNVNLNDKMEQQRAGVSEFASGRFITCFAHTSQESVPFWVYYGKKPRKDKLLLQFRNFAANFEDCIRTDFAKVKDDKLCFFRSPEYGRTINHQRTIDTAQYDLRACIDSISVFDVEYVPSDSSVFTVDNSGQVDVDFARITEKENAVIKLQSYNPTVLGKQKTASWEYEKETRILSSISNPLFKEWNYIDLQLHSEMFRDLKIVLSPWDDGTLRERVEEIISKSCLPADILNSITIHDSELKDTLNLPE